MSAHVPLEGAGGELVDLVELVARRNERAVLVRDGEVVGAVISREELALLEEAEADEASDVAAFDAAMADPANRGPSVPLETLRAELASEERGEYRPEATDS